MTKTITWNGVASTSVSDLVIGQVWRDVLGPVRGVHIPLDGREGTYYFPQKPGRRSIKATCFLLVDDMADRGDAVEDLADWLDVQTEAQLIISDNPGRFYNAVLGEIPSPEEWRQLAGPFDIEWLVQPYSFDINVSSESWTSDADDLHAWAPGLKTDVYPVIQIHPTNGTITAFNIQDHNGRHLYWEGNLASGGYITINSLVPTVLLGSNADVMLTGAYDPSLRSMANVTGQFPILTTDATNSIHFIRTGGTATAIGISVFYRKKYRR